ncbi:rCG63561 [Rattus norvegicus]|uniref:RCG63561 n=1 Tax=Rattus norvegicus TaxID=10116 RepID=A6IVW3_RAT|nr:rCG63561 [Rattus norvegicus]
MRRHRANHELVSVNCLTSLGNNLLSTVTTFTCLLAISSNNGGHYRDHCCELLQIYVSTVML